MSPDDDAQRRWAELTTPDLEVDMGRIQEAAEKFERGVRRRNRVELAAGVVVAVVFGCYAAWFDHPLARFGAVGVVAGVGVVAAILTRWGRAPALPDPAGATTAYVEAYRVALLRQARVLAWAPAWYVLPLLVPAAIFAVGLHAQLGREGSVAGEFAVLGIVGLAVSALNLYGSRRMRREAEALG